MAELKKHTFLLSIIALLLIIKIIIVPVFEWQNELITDIVLLVKKQNKIENVLSQYEKNKKQNELLSMELSKTQQLLFPNQSETDFKLTQQKMLEALLAKHNMKSQNMGWQTYSVLSELSATRYPIKMNITGKHSNLINFVSDIENNKPLIELNSFNVSFKGQREQNLGRITASLTLYLYADVNTEQAIKVTSL